MDPKFYLHRLSRRAKPRLEKGPLDWGAEGGPETIPMNVGYPYPDSYPLAELVSAMAQVIQEDGADALSYSGGALARDLHRLVVERCSQRGIRAETGNVLITSGSMQGIGLLCNLLLDYGNTALVEGPTFMGTLGILQNYGASLRTVDVLEDGFSVREMERVLSDCAAHNTRPKFFYTIPNFHNPTGHTMSLRARRQVLELAEAYDFLVIEDDAYGELRYEGEDIPTLASLDQNGRVLHLGSMSKILAPSLRIGWIVGPSVLIETLAEMKTDGGTSPLMRSLTAAYLGQTGMDARIQHVRAGYRLRRDAALAALSRHMPADCSWSSPEGGYFLWVTLPAGLDANAVISDLLAEGAVVLPGTLFYPDGRGHRNLRLSFSYAGPDELERGIEALGRVVRRHQSSD